VTLGGGARGADQVRDAAGDPHRIQRPTASHRISGRLTTLTRNGWRRNHKSPCKEHRTNGGTELNAHAAATC
jgi:hypothetical protein